MTKIIREKYVPDDNDFFDTIALVYDNWDDFGYKTSYAVYYCDNDGIATRIGRIKIYHTSLDDDNSERKIDLLIKKESNIKQLDKNYCSLGQDLRYYQNLKEKLPQSYMQVLSRLRDLAIDSAIYDEFSDAPGVSCSLLRESSAIKALNEAKRTIEGIMFVNDMSFSYKFTPPYSSKKTTIKIDFHKRDKDFPYRVVAIVGKNGTGKTRFLSELADYLSGNTDMRKTHLIGNDVSRRPAFYKVMSISYSVFDEFRKSNDNGLCSYIYCGINIIDENGISRPMSKEELKKECQDALLKVRDSNRYNDWKSIIKELIGQDGLEEVVSQLESESNSFLLSSGQNILILSMTMALANIENESILLVDEPETHLHPNAIASFMRMLNLLLEKYNSYAILATHSPIVLQELASRQIVIFDRVDDFMISRTPPLECFGENVSRIIDSIFEVKDTESSYRTILRKAYMKKTENEIHAYFEDNLSINAMIYLKMLSKGEK